MGLTPPLTPLALAVPFLKGFCNSRLLEGDHCADFLSSSITIRAATPGRSRAASSSPSPTSPQRSPLIPAWPRADNSPVWVDVYPP